MGQAASTSQMGRFETEWLARPENSPRVTDLPGLWIDAVHKRRPPRVIVLDMEFEREPDLRGAGGQRVQRPLRLHCYHPLFVFQPAWRSGAVCRCGSGNVHSADGWREVLEPVIARYRDTVKRRYFRGDAASPRISYRIPRS